MVKFGDRIRALANALGKDEQVVAQELGLTKSKLSHYINGRTRVPSELLQLIVDTYKINPLFLFRMDEPLYEEKREVVQDYKYFPTAISAGLPFTVDGINKAEKISLPDVLMGNNAGNKEIFIARIYGDSMDNIIEDGSIIAIKPTTTDSLKEGDIVVFSTNHEYSVKHYHKKPGKLIFKPNSTNKDHDEQHFSTDDNINIHGKVVMWAVTKD